MLLEQLTLVLELGSQIYVQRGLSFVSVITTLDRISQQQDVKGFQVCWSLPHISDLSQYPGSVAFIIPNSHWSGSQ